MNARRRVTPVVAACLVLLDATTARAGCKVKTSSVLFGTYNVFDDRPLDSTGEVDFRCEQQTSPIRITLSKGSSPTFQPRGMLMGSQALEYNLFKDGFSEVWGDGTESTTFYYSSSPTNNTWIPLTIYGRIFAAQDVSAGTYGDTVQVEIDF